MAHIAYSILLPSSFANVLMCIGIFSTNNGTSSTHIQIQLRTYKMIEVYNLTFSADSNKANEVEQFCHELKHDLESKQNTKIQVSQSVVDFQQNNSYIDVQIKGIESKKDLEQLVKHIEQKNLDSQFSKCNYYKKLIV